MGFKSVNIAIFNSNSKNLLKECLPSIIKSASLYKGRCTITVVDNHSTDDIISFLRKRFSKVKIYKAPANKVLVSYNSYIKTVKEDITVVLNNGMKVAPDFIEPLTHYFDNKDTFFVSPKHLNFDGKEYQGGKNKMTMKFGYPSIGPFYKDHEKYINISSLNLFTENGAFSTKIFNKLKGFDKLFLPGSMKDTDICYRAWKSGYKGYYEPKSVIYHKGSVKFKKVYSEKQQHINNYKNTFLFIWKNFTGKNAIKHKLSLFVSLPVFFITGRFYHIVGFFAALKKSSHITKNRLSKISDKDILPVVNRNYPLPVYNKKMEKKTLSIVIPTYNRIQDLKVLISSIVSQKYSKKDIEIVISDDGSTDNTEKEIRKLIKKYSELKYVKHQNSGPAATRNNGIKTACGKYIGLIDSDVIADKNLIKNVLKAFKNNPKADGIEGASFKKIIKIEESLFTHTVESTKGGRWLTCNLFLTKAILHKVNGFDEKYKHPNREDTDLGFALLKEKAKIIFDKNVVIFHPVFPSSWKHLFKLTYYGIYEPLLIKKYPEYYFKHLKWFDSWAVPVYYGGYYTLPLFLFAYFYIKEPWLMISGLTLYTASVVVSVYALFKKKKVLFNEMVIASLLMLFLPFLRLYWICHGIIKYWIFKR